MRNSHHVNIMKKKSSSLLFLSPDDVLEYKIIYLRWSVFLFLRKYTNYIFVNSKTVTHHMNRKFCADFRYCSFSNGCRSIVKLYLSPAYDFYTNISCHKNRWSSRKLKYQSFYSLSIHFLVRISFVVKLFSCDIL